MVNVTFFFFLSKFGPTIRLQVKLFCPSIFSVGDYGLDFRCVHKIKTDMNNDY
jgi:hypothetical protein